ncbi:MAG: hypothetical protein P8N15_03825 [Flavobacteriaceae bacterium]|nr:hypothetical protein [Flavobacteriaceae bacterium]
MKTTYFLFALALPLMVLAQAPQPKEALTKKAAFGITRQKNATGVGSF